MDELSSLKMVEIDAIVKALNEKKNYWEAYTDQLINYLQDAERENDREEEGRLSRELVKSQNALNGVLKGMAIFIAHQNSRAMEGLT